MLESEFLANRLVFLTEEITTPLATQVIKRLLLLDAQSKDDPIDLYITSPGGDVTAGLSIIDAMLCLDAPVHTICLGQAASMAAYILAAGAPGYRYATPHAEVMLHQLQLGLQGGYRDVQARAERVAKLNECLLKLLAGWTGQPYDQLERDCQTEHWFTAEAAREYGLLAVVMEPKRGVGHVAID